MAFFSILSSSLASSLGLVVWYTLPQLFCPHIDTLARYRVFSISAKDWSLLRYAYFRSDEAQWLLGPARPRTVTYNNAVLFAEST